jgi:signal peptidase II
MKLVFFILLLVDQITKAIFATRDFLFKNYGLPFGLDFGSGWNNAILLLAYLIGGALIYNLRLQGKFSYLGKPLFFAGAASNLADSLIFGYVRDFIDLDLGFVFNLADVFIVVGLVIIVLSIAKNEGKVENPGAISKT